jgi:hypothetical protein
MKSFLLKGKRPIIKWGMLPNETFFEGNTPEGFSLAVTPSEGYIVVDVDRHGDEDGFQHIPFSLENELKETLNYSTKNNGSHFWFKYTGDKPLGNKSSGKSIDLRTHRGYVVWYPEVDVRSVMHLVNNTSEEMNLWLEEMFSYVDKK